MIEIIGKIRMTTPEEMGKSGQGQQETESENYTLEQIIDAITQAGEEMAIAIMWQDREMVKGILKDYLP